MKPDDVFLLEKVTWASEATDHVTLILLHVTQSWQYHFIGHTKVVCKKQSDDVFLREQVMWSSNRSRDPIILHLSQWPWKSQSPRRCHDHPKVKKPTYEATDHVILILPSQSPWQPLCALISFPLILTSSADIVYLFCSMVGLWKSRCSLDFSYIPICWIF